MQDADFSLPIVVELPERRARADRRVAGDRRAAAELATTTPFKRAALPGVDLRTAEERAVTTRRPVPTATRKAAAPNAAAPKDAAATSTAAVEPLPAPRHAWLPSPSHPVPSRVRARSLLGVPPPPAPRAVPLSDDDERRMQRRVRAWRRIAWAQRLLERFQFVAAQP
jgi:hypothetical protein